VNSFRRQLLLKTYVAFDLCLMGLSLYAAVSGRDVFRPLSTRGEVTVQLHLVFAMAVLVYGWHSVFAMIGLHRSRRLSTGMREEVVDILKASLMATVLVAVTAWLFRVTSITASSALRFLVLSAGSMIASRVIMRRFLKTVRRGGRNLRHLVIAGTNPRALGFASDILAHPELGYRLEGFIDSTWFGPKMHAGSPEIVCGVHGFRAYLRDHVVDELVVALPIKSSYAEAHQLVEVCREQGIVVRVLSDFFDVSTSRTRIDQFETNPVVSIYTFPIDEMPVTAKRVLDVLFSAAVITLLSPVLLIALILVKLESEGPAIFAQERVGLNKRRFRMFKLRTMVRDAERLQPQLESKNEAQGPVFKIKDDPRITRIGRVLRKTSLDELPQLFNVLTGDMSLVGPRPLPVRDYKGFNHDWQRRRFSVRPGITCLWQVSGRSGISFNQWMDLDMEYIDNWSIWLDMKILARTIPAVVRGSGAA
jgi:exopolysaccharide biosynthesis polyprenyl glycosylphosphotransferase